MKKIIFIYVTTVFLGINNVFAQYHEIKPGEQIPNFTFPDTYNAKNSTVKLSDFKGKLVILDFWGPYCLPCIAGFPKIDSLQKLFEGQIQILAISNLTKAEVAKFFKSHINVHRPNVPFITNAKHMDSVFPHTGVPFQVWIDGSGKVLLYGDPTSLTVKNINNSLKTGTAFYRKASKNVYTSFIDSRWKNLVVYASSISRYKSDSLRMHPELNAKGKQLAETGPVPFLYQRAFSDSSFKFLDVYSPGRVILEVNDKTKFIKSPEIKGEEAMKWIDDNYFTYQLIEPNNFPGNMYHKMKDDLDNYFQLTSKIEKRMVECYILVSTGNSEVLKTKGQTGFNNFYKMNDVHSTEYAKIRQLKNQPFLYLSNAVKDFVEYKLNSPFFDESGISENIDVEMSGKILDDMNFDEWQDGLKKYNLAIEKKRRLIDVLVISDFK
ncbi:TlpA family protein disulfide reductase [Mucilaginibacter agri]|uniref:Redoxin domain-containing protein n=1 Tax=Mucilaginibacter agri TaxID=2695265 RepID=A0A965ZCP9_9SPHI|nr:TlpA disulfide reductase family protein [Mucilaginibacter agri]NCD68584.1 redoxin domain-containing protein [Mucilaginibacter agri]